MKITIFQLVKRNSLRSIILSSIVSITFIPQTAFANEGRFADKKGAYKSHDKSRPLHRQDSVRVNKNIQNNNNNRHNTVVVPSNRHRTYRNVVVVRPHGNVYYGYGNYYNDNDAWKWLAFTAITLKLLDNLNEQQEREHEAAQVKATTAPINEQINWSDGDASGSVTATREGTTTSGRYCREFQQKITVGGKNENAYGTACQNQDGSWEIVSTGS
jgi:outer membrane surface antigen